MSRRFKDIEILEERRSLEPDERRFTDVRYFRVRNQFHDSVPSREYRLDMVSHRGVDAVCAVPYHVENDVCRILMIKSFRPVLKLRSVSPEAEPFLWEIVAGVLEEGENSIEGVKKRSADELSEEAGIKVDWRDVAIMGEAMYMSPGIYTEKIWFTAVETDIRKRLVADHDGSVQEELIEQHEISLDEAFDWLNRGMIKDAKTEIALYRLKKMLAGHRPCRAGAEEIR